MDAIKNLIATSKRLAGTDPQDASVQKVIQNLQSQVQLLNEQAREDRAFGQSSMKDDVAFIGEQIKNLKSAASIPAHNYQRVLHILNGLDKACVLASRPQNAQIRPKLALIAKKVAGIFAEVDLVEDLDRPLSEIEKAVHSLYGDQSLNSSAFFERRGKGHHSESK
jgi:hypothetical protein